VNNEAIQVRSIAGHWPGMAEQIAEQADRPTRYYGQSRSDMRRDAPDNHFDCIIRSNILEHLSEPCMLLPNLQEKPTAAATVRAPGHSCGKQVRCK
jgi:hypothetical protein